MSNVENTEMLEWFRQGVGVVEDAVAEAADVRVSVRDGQSRITVEYEWDGDDEHETPYGVTD